MKQQLNRQGYKTAKAYVNGRYKHLKVHREVLTAYNRPPLADEVGRHLDGNQLNNHISNLAWGTAKENQRDMVRHGHSLQGIKHHKARLNEDQVLEIRGLYGAGITSFVVGEHYGIDPSTAGDIGRGKIWKHL